VTAVEKETARVLVFLLLLLVLLLVFALVASGGTKQSEQVRMVERDIRSRGINDPAVLRAMAGVQRHLFVDESFRDRVYGDHPLPIGEGQTISQPYMVALMTEVLRLKPSDRVLEVGTGSGYQAAVLATIVKEVYTIEIVGPLADRARTLLSELGYGNVTVRSGDGYRGWEEQAPFDAIVVTAAADRIPPPLISQLKTGGRLVMPLGRTVFFQTLVVATRRNGTLEVRELAPVAFVPMTGEVAKEG
jgi:protein-L-isoaspartate(D-aspartate) O-methyltransferase